MVEIDRGLKDDLDLSSFTSTTSEVPKQIEEEQTSEPLIDDLVVNPNKPEQSKAQEQNDILAQEKKKPNVFAGFLKEQYDLYQAHAIMAQYNTALTKEDMPDEQALEEAQFFLAKHQQQNKGAWGWIKEHSYEMLPTMAGGIRGGIAGHGVMNEVADIFLAERVGAAAGTLAGVGASLVSGALAPITIPLAALSVSVGVSMAVYSAKQKLDTRAANLREKQKTGQQLREEPTWEEVGMGAVRALEYVPTMALAGGLGVWKERFRQLEEQGVINQKRNYTQNPEDFKIVKKELDITEVDIRSELGLEQTMEPSLEPVVETALKEEPTVSTEPTTEPATETAVTTELATETTATTELAPETAVTTEAAIAITEPAPKYAYEKGQLAKELVASEVGKATVTDIGARKGFAVEIDKTTGSARLSKKHALQDAKAINLELEQTHKTMLDSKTSYAEKNRYLYSQQAHLATGEKAFIADYTTTLFDGLEIGNQEMRLYDIIFSNDIVDNAIGDAIALGKKIESLPKNIEELYQKRLATDKLPTAVDLANKYVENYKAMLKKIARDRRAMGLEVPVEEENYLGQNHNAHKVNAAGPKRWYHFIIDLLDDKKTFEEPFNERIIQTKKSLKENIALEESKLEKILSEKKAITETELNTIKNKIDQLNKQLEDARTWNELSELEKNRYKKRFLLGTGKLKKNGQISEGAYGTIARRDGQLDGTYVGSGPTTWNKDRVLHFKDQASRKKYLQEFGRGNPLVLTSASDLAIRSGKANAVVNSFGTNPGAMMDAMRGHIAKSAPTGILSPSEIKGNFLSGMSKNFQKDLLHGKGSTFWDRHPMASVVIDNLQEGSKAARTRKAWDYSLIQEPIMAYVAEGTYMGYSPTRIPGIIKDYYGNYPNGTALQRIGNIERFYRLFDDRGNSELQNFKDRTPVQLSQWYKNANRLSNVGGMISDHNMGVTRVDTQFNLGQLLEGEGTGKHARILKLSGITKEEFAVTKKLKKLFVTELESPICGKYKLLLWQDAMARIEKYAPEEVKAYLINLARKWGQAEEKLVDRVMTRGDNISKSFIIGGVDNAFFRSFVENSFPFRGYLWKDIMLGIENGDWRISKTDTAQAIGSYFLQRMIIGAGITAIRQASKGRYHDLKTEEGRRSFGKDAFIYGGAGSVFSDVLINEMHTGWRSGKRVATDLASVVGGVATGLAVEKALLAADALHQACEGESAKALKSAVDILPFMADHANVLGIRSLIDTIFAEQNPDYNLSLQRSKKYFQERGIQEAYEGSILLDAFRKASGR